MYQKRVGITKSQFRASEKDGKKFVEGMFVVFNKQTKLSDTVWEEIAPEAITESFEHVKALYNHNMDIVLGSVQNKTLSLEKTSTGLRGIIEINQADPDAVGAYARIKRGDIKGCSFGFMPVAEEYRSEGGRDIFRVTALELYEVSPCVFPAYPQTTIEARKKDLKEIQVRNRKEKMQSKDGLRERKIALIKKINDIKQGK